MSTTNEFPRSDERIVDLDRQADDLDRRFLVAIGSIIFSGYVFRAATPEEVLRLDPSFVEYIRQQVADTALQETAALEYLTFSEPAQANVNEMAA